MHLQPPEEEMRGGEVLGGRGGGCVNVALTHRVPGGARDSALSFGACLALEGESQVVGAHRSPSPPSLPPMSPQGCTGWGGGGSYRGSFGSLRTGRTLRVRGEKERTVRASREGGREGGGREGGGEGVHSREVQGALQDRWGQCGQECPVGESRGRGQGGPRASQRVQEPPPQAIGGAGLAEAQGFV